MQINIINGTHPIKQRQPMVRLFFNLRTKTRAVKPNHVAVCQTSKTTHKAFPVGRACKAYDKNVNIKMKNCFQIHFQPMYLYVKKAISLAFDNDSKLLCSASIYSFGSQILQDFFNVNYFGVSNLTLLFVLGTILADAYYGIRKSVMESRIAKNNYESIPDDTPEKRAFYKTYQIKKFNPAKLQYTFFKAFTLLAYLFFAKSILDSDPDGDLMISIIGFSSAVILKAPVIIFWYYDFKSIGENTAFVFGKKAPIFQIVEKIFEPNLMKFFKSKDDEQPV